MTDIPTCGICDGVRVCKDDSDKPLTLRERAAIAAMQSLLDAQTAWSLENLQSVDWQQSVKLAVKCADALVKELSK